MSYDEWIGREVDYCSKSGKHYVAIVSAIPENPIHGYSDLPSVGLIFENRDRPGKFIKKDRVIPRDESIGWVNGTWAPLEGGRQLWEKRKTVRPIFVIDGLSCGSGVGTTNPDYIRSNRIRAN